MDVYVLERFDVDDVLVNLEAGPRRIAGRKIRIVTDRPQLSISTKLGIYRNPGLKLLVGRLAPVHKIQVPI